MNVSTTIGLVVPGMVFDYAGSTSPSGFLLCYGQAISRTTYADLYSVLGTTYGAGNGTTTFNIPDLRGRVAAGKDNMGGSSASRLTTAIAGGTLGTAGGADMHTITSSEMPTHNHTLSHTHDFTHTHTTGTESATHTHGYTHPLGGSSTPQAGTGGNTSSTAQTGTESATHTHTTNSQSTSTTGLNSSDSGSTGSGSATSWIQPTIVLNKIIKY